MSGCSLQDPIGLSLMQCTVEGSKRIVRAAAWAVAIRAVQEQRLIDRFQDLSQCSLDNLVFQTADPQCSRLALPFRDVDPLDDLVAPLALPQPLMQVAEVVLQLLAIVLFRDPILARSRAVA